MDMNAQEFADLVMSFASTELWEPGGYYNKDGQQLEYYFKNNASYGDWVDHYLTIMRDHKTDEITGCIFYFNKETFVGGSEYFKDGNVCLDNLLEKRMQSYEPCEEHWVKYNDVLKLAKGIIISLE